MKQGQSLKKMLVVQNPDDERAWGIFEVRHNRDSDSSRNAESVTIVTRVGLRACMRLIYLIYHSLSRCGSIISGLELLLTGRS